MPPEQNPQTPNTPPQQPAPSPLRQIRTFQGDVAEALSSQKESLFSIQQQELKKSSGYTVAQQPPKQGGRSFIFFIGSLLFIALAGIGGWYTYNEFVRKTAVPVVAIPSSRIIPAESTKEIALTGLSRDAIFAAVTENTSDVKEGELRHLLLEDGSGNTASTSAFFVEIETEAPGNLVRSFDTAFMLGSLGQSRFLLIKLSSFQNAFAGMLSWEKEIATDLSGLFAGSDILKQIGNSAVFTDVVSRNKDVRVLSYQESPALLYSFFDNQYLIITDRMETLQIVIDRLTQNKLTR